MTRLLTEKPSWANLLLKELQKIGGIECIKANFDIKAIPPAVTKFYKSMLSDWAEFNQLPTVATHNILEQPLWNNKFVILNKRSIFFRNIYNCGFVVVADLIKNNEFLSFKEAQERGVKNKSFLQWISLLNAIPQEWKTQIAHFPVKEHTKAPTNAEVLIRNNRKIQLRSFKTNIAYIDMINKVYSEPTSLTHLKKRAGCDINWHDVFNRIGKTTIDTYSRYFQYKILNNILFLNRDLCRFKLKSSPRCSFCYFYNETIDHLFIYCRESKNLYFEIKKWASVYNINLPEQNFSTMILGVDDCLINHLILIFKILLYKARDTQILPSIVFFQHKLSSIINMEETIARKKGKINQHKKKWEKLAKFQHCMLGKDIL